MKREFARIISCSALLVSQWASGSIVGAQESFRVKRPSASEAIAQTRPPLRATATMTLGSSSLSVFQNAVHAWEAKNIPSGCGPAPAKMSYNSLTNSYVPLSTVLHGRGPSGPKIKVITLVMLAMHDPALPLPEGWWRTMRDELSESTTGPQWGLWFSAVTKNFEARANQLYGTTGAAALHVIINPDGTIFEMSPYTGYEREYPNLPISEQTLIKLRDVVNTVGVFPPLPDCTKLRALHLIVDGSAWILSP